MTYKTILTVRSTPDGSTTALDQAETMVRRADGHLDVLCLGVDRTRVGYYDGGANAIAINTMLDRAREEVQATEECCNGHLRKARHSQPPKNVLQKFRALAA